MMTAGMIVAARRQQPVGFGSIAVGSLIPQGTFNHRSRQFQKPTVASGGTPTWPILHQRGRGYSWPDFVVASGANLKIGSADGINIAHDDGQRPTAGTDSYSTVQP